MSADAWLNRAAAAAAIVSTAGCTTFVTVPKEPGDPVTVFIADYGRHSSVLLPDDRGGLIEYAYGEWKWFALGQNQSGRAPLILLLPSQGALGSRRVESAGVTTLQSTIGADHVYHFPAERDAVAALRESLARRHGQHLDQAVVNQESGLTCVPDDHTYTIWHNCNHATSEWLRALGCKVGFTSVIADFTLSPAADDAAIVSVDKADPSAH